MSSTTTGRTTVCTHCAKAARERVRAARENFETARTDAREAAVTASIWDMTPVPLTPTSAAMSAAQTELDAATRALARLESVHAEAMEGGPYNMLTPEDIVHTDRLSPDPELYAHNYKEFCRSCGMEDISAFIVCDGCGSRIGTDCDCIFRK